MIRHEIPAALVDRTENMLAGTVEGTPDRGCPQGGLLFPLLWCLIVNDLVMDLQKEGFHISGRMDDIATTVHGHFLTTLRDLMEKALKMTHSWCNTKGLAVNPR